MFVVNAQEMREMDRFTIEEMGIPAEILMENAGAAAAREITLRQPLPGCAVVLAGQGNNGGDGWVVARWLLNNQWQVKAFLLGQEANLSAESRIHYHALQRMGHPPSILSRFANEKDDAWRLFVQSLAEADVVVDALIGVGLKQQVRPEAEKAIQAVNGASKKWVVALDVPSGVDADTGEVRGAAIYADLTVAFGCYKRAHFLFPGAECCGERVVADISLVVKNEPRGFLYSEQEAKGSMAKRYRQAHKGHFGHLLIVGGSTGLAGAPVLAGSSALSSGAGLVTLAVPEQVLPQVAAMQPELMTWAWPQTSHGVLSLQDDPNQQLAGRRFHALALGPGMGRVEDTSAWLQSLFDLPLPLVVDADGLNLLARDLSQLKPRSHPTVLTPHPGEMARLMGLSVQEVERSRWELSRSLAMEKGAYVVLKGAHTLTAAPDGTVYVNTSGSPAMAKAGSGDVLTGILGSLLAQGLPPQVAVPFGVFVHGKAGELAAFPSEHSSSPLAIIAQIGNVLQFLQE